MGTIGIALLLLSCAPEPGGRSGASRRPPPPPAGAVTVTVPARPGRAELDAVLDAHEPARLLVAGTDADLAAVLLRLLRTDRLRVEVAYLPAGRSTAARAWGLPTGAGATQLAVAGTASPVPLVRSDAGGVVVGSAEIRRPRGECYCDDVLVLRGSAARLVVTPSPGGIAVRAGRRRARPGGAIRPVPPTAARGRGAAVGRAVQVGCEPATVVSDGVAHPRAVERWTWYRNAEDWRLVRP